MEYIGILYTSMMSCIISVGVDMYVVYLHVALSLSKMFVLDINTWQYDLSLCRQRLPHLSPFIRHQV